MDSGEWRLETGKWRPTQGPYCRTDNSVVAADSQCILIDFRARAYCVGLSVTQSSLATSLLYIYFMVTNLIMASVFIGRWKLESSENFDQFMKAIGQYYRPIVGVFTPGTDLILLLVLML